MKIRGSRNGDGAANTYNILIDRQLEENGSGPLTLIVVAGLEGFKVAKPFLTTRDCSFHRRAP
jgi:hypothetical protein